MLYPRSMAPREVPRGRCGTTRHEDFVASFETAALAAGTRELRSAASGQMVGLARWVRPPVDLADLQMPAGDRLQRAARHRGEDRAQQQVVGLVG
jgi:hypothetical protein